MNDAEIEEIEGTLLAIENEPSSEFWASLGGEATTIARKLLNEVKNLKLTIFDKDEEIGCLESLYEDRQKLLEAIPECPDHGACIPHAIEWVKLRIQSDKPQ